MREEIAPHHVNNWKLAFAALALAALVAFVIYLVHPPQTALDQAISLVKANRAARAVPILEEIARKQPDNHEVFPWLATGYLVTDRIAEGRTALDTALKFKLPCNITVPVVLSYAKYYEARSDFREAEHLFTSAERSCPSQELLEGKAEMHLSWAKFEHKEQNLEAAIQHLQTSYKLLNSIGHPLKATIPHLISDEYRQMAALAETVEKDDQKAIRLLETSLNIADEAATRMALGNIFKRIDRIGKAIEHYRVVCQYDPNNLEARHYLVELFISNDDIACAQEALLELTSKERSVENFELLANLNLKLANYPGAVKALEDALVLRPNDIPLLTKLEGALLNWVTVLTKQDKQQEALSAKGHAERIAEVLKELQKASEKSKGNSQGQQNRSGYPPVSLYASRIWLSKGSLTPEGEIKVKNISQQSVADLALTIVFYDNTTKKNNGSVTVSAASKSHAMAPNSIRSLYFSCPNIVKSDHQLAVIIFWKGYLLKELPVVKEH